jgi:hypothetical protein
MEKLKIPFLFYKIIIFRAETVVEFSELLVRK